MRPPSIIRALAGAACVLAAAGAAGGADAPARLIERYRLASGAAVGAHVVRLADGKVLVDVDSTRPLVPASNQKLLTTAAVLKRLGAGFRFRTTLTASGADLVVFGDGDPTIGDARIARALKRPACAVFDRWARAVRAAGIERVTGNLVIRAGIFQPPGQHPAWPAAQLNRWYAAPVAGVNYNGNCLDVGFIVAAGRVRPTISPVSRFLTIDSRVRPGKRHLWHCRFDADQARITLTGTVKPGGAALSVAVPRPAMLFGQVLAERLARAGVAIAGRIVVSTDPADAAGPADDARVIAAETTPLAAALWRANTHSLNMMAECLFLRAAADAAGPATWKKAARITARVLVDDYGLDARQFSISDGSGLSRLNRASPAAITALLRRLASNRTFLRSLSVAGVDGSLRRRLAAADLRGRVMGKTGSLAGVSALSGYILDRRARPRLAFSLIVNGSTYGPGHNARHLQIGFCRALIATVDSPAATSPSTRPAGKGR